MRTARRRWPVAALAVLLTVGACAGGDTDTAADPNTPESSPAETDEPSPEAGEDTEPIGADLSEADINALTAEFTDQPLTGGQAAPRLYKWVNDDVAIFIQFDDPEAPTELRYLGVSVKGRFCAEDQPGGPDGGFPHFHQVDAPDYAEGHAGEAGTEGYWLSWVAVGSFTQRDGREVEPGVDYEFSPTPAPPECGADADADFDAPEAGAPSEDELAAFADLFDDQPLTGGQVAPRLYKWVNEDVSIFVQFDDLEAPTELLYIGISVRGEFCTETQPTEDFPHFHRTDAADYAEGHGESPGDTGYWLLWVATDSFEGFDGRAITPGVDREFSPTPPPAC